MAELEFNATEFNQATERMEMVLSGIEKESLQKVADEILRRSQNLVPRGDTLTLQNSGIIEPDGDGLIIGYNTPYASRLHENPDFNFRKDKNPNAQGKYLETPIKENLNAFRQILVTDLQQGLK